MNRSTLCIGADVHLDEIVLCAVDQAHGHEVTDRFRVTNNLPGAQSAVKIIAAAATELGYGRIAIGWEATGMLWIPFHRYLPKPQMDHAAAHRLVAPQLDSDQIQPLEGVQYLLTSHLNARGTARRGQQWGVEQGIRGEILFCPQCTLIHRLGLGLDLDSGGDLCGEGHKIAEVVVRQDHQPAGQLVSPILILIGLRQRVLSQPLPHRFDSRFRLAHEGELLKNNLISSEKCIVAHQCCA